DERRLQQLHLLLCRRTARARAPTARWSPRRDAHRVRVLSGSAPAAAAALLGRARLQRDALERDGARRPFRRHGGARPVRGRSAPVGTVDRVMAMLVAAVYCALTLASFMMGHHFAISAF